MHRLIHPWSKNGCVRTANKALSTLSLWRDILHDIGSDSFAQTGVFALDNADVSYQSVQGIDNRLLSATTVGELMPLLAGVNCCYAHHFPQFGVLFADKILTDLVQYLRNNGVQLYEGSAVVSIDAQRAEVYFSDGKIVAGDNIIIAAGYGADAILRSSFKGA